MSAVPISTKTGIANLPFHYGKAPRWLFDRMVKLARGQALNLVAGESDSARTTITDIVTNEKPDNILAELKRLKTLDLPSHHYLSTRDLHPDSLSRIF